MTQPRKPASKRKTRARGRAKAAESAGATNTPPTGGTAPVAPGKGDPPVEQPYIVYQLDPEIQREGSARPGLRTGAGQTEPVKFTPTEVGCYVAKSAEDACKKAVLDRKELNNFAAVAMVFPTYDITTGVRSANDYTEFQPKAKPQAAD